MKVVILLCFVSSVFGAPVAPPPYGAAATAPGAPCPTAAVQAAPFAAPAPGHPLPFAGPVGPAPPPNPALMAKLKPLVDQWTAALTSGNGDAFSAMFAPDAVIYSDHDYNFIDRTGAKKWLAKFKPQNFLTGPIQIVSIQDLSPYLVMWGKFSDARGPGDVVMWWADVNGQLLLKSFIYNWDAAWPAPYDTMGDAAAKAKVRDHMKEWSRLFAAGDLEGVSQLYHEHAKVFPHDDVTHEGRDGARHYYQSSRDHGVTRTEFIVMEAEQNGDTINAWTYYRDYKGNDPQLLGINLFVMKEVAGKLQIKYDIFNKDVDETIQGPEFKMAEEYYNDWTAQFNAGNIPAVVAKYEPDASRISSGAASVTGHPAIQQQLQADYASGNRYNIEILTVKQIGEYMLVTGTQQTLRNDVVVQDGVLMDVLHVVGGKPKHVMDTYASN